MFVTCAQHKTKQKEDEKVKAQMKSSMCMMRSGAKDAYSALSNCHMSESSLYQLHIDKRNENAEVERDTRNQNSSPLNKME